MKLIPNQRYLKSAGLAVMFTLAGVITVLTQISGILISILFGVLVYKTHMPGFSKWFLFFMDGLLFFKSIEMLIIGLNKEWK